MIIHRCHNHHWHWKLKAVCPAFCLKESAAKAIWQSGNILQSLPILFVAQEKSPEAHFVPGLLCHILCVYIYYIIYIMFLYLYTVHLLQILEKKPERRFCFSRNLSDTDEGRFFWGCSYLYLYLYILFLSYTFIYIFSPEICLIPAEDAFSQAALIISNQKTRISQLFKCGLSGLFHVFYF